MTRGAGAVAVALLLAGLPGGCSSRRRESVDRVVAAETEAAARLATIGLTREQLAQAAQEAVRASPHFGPPAPPEDVAARRWLGRLVINRAETLPGGGGPPLAQVVLTLEFSPQGGGGTQREVARGADPVGGGPQGVRQAFARASAAALGRAVDGFALLLAAERKREGALLADLRAPDARVRDCAVRTLAERRSRSAVPALVERLADPDPEVVERAIGALGQVGDPSAVAALVRLAQKRDGPSVAHLARIIGDLGGPDAYAYLLTLASGHSDRMVRSAAQQALDEMQARAAEGAGAGDGARPAVVPR